MTAKTNNFRGYVFTALLSWAVLASLVVFGFTSTAHAAVTGAGTQSTSTTTNAIASVQSATGLNQIKAGVQSFLNQYGMTLYTDCPNLSGVDNGGTACTSLADGNNASTKKMAVQFIEEWSKYTTTWVGSSGATKIYFVTNFKRPIGTNNALVSVAALPGNNINGPLYDVQAANDETYMRETIHHEYEHFIEYAKYGDYYRNDTAWVALNPAGFSYGGGGASCYQTNSTCLSGPHPRNGFVSGYAASGIAEDKAETYAYLMTTGPYHDLQGWLSTDTALAQKVNAYKSFITSIDSSMNASYFQAIHEYADENNSSQGEGMGVISVVNGVTVTEILQGQDYSRMNLSIGSKDTQVIINNGIIGDATVNEGSYLKGNGKVGVLDVLAGAHLAPGNSPGCLSASDTTLSEDSLYDVEIAGNTVCNEYDQLRVTGTVTIDNAVLNTQLLNNFQPAKDASFTIIDNDGNDPVTGTFKDLPEGGTVTVGSAVFKVSYVGGNGNDVVLTVTENPNATDGATTPPGAPNTGMQMLSTNPLLTLVLTSFSALALFALAKKYSRQ